MRKKLFSILLSLAMVITMMPAMSMTTFASTNVGAWTELQSGINSATSAIEFALTSDLTAGAGDSAITVGAEKNVTIDLSGHKIDRHLTEATADGFVIKVEGNLTIKDSVGGGKITGGYNKASGGGVYVASSGVLTMSNGVISDNVAKNNTSGQYGAGVYVEQNATFNMTGGEISGNSGGQGAGVYSKGTFTMTGDSLITGNTGTNGGGVGIEGGTFTMKDNSKISNNIGNGGGGVYVKEATFTMRGGEISGNSANNGGGGISNAGGTVNIMTPAVINNNRTDNGIGGGIFNVNISSKINLYGATISGNTAKNGAGIYNNYGEVNFQNYPSKIENNTATESGGGIYNASGNIQLTQSDEISGNSATNSGGGIYTTSFIGATSTIINNCQANKGGAVYVKNNGRFEMVGGIIYACKAVGTGACGGGTYVEKGGTATFSNYNSSATRMVGCTAESSGGAIYSDGAIGFETATISNCSVPETGNGGGIYLDNQGTIFIGKEAKTDGNKKGNTINNLYLCNGAKAWIGTGADVPVPQAGMSVGITTATTPIEGTPVQFTQNGTEEQKGYFFSDNDAYEVKFNTDHLELAVKTTPEPAKTTVSLLRAYTGGKVGKKAVKLCWNKVPGATKYKVYGTRCGGKFKKLKEYKTTRKYTVKKIGGKKLLAHKTYKFYVAAYDKDGKRITRSKIIHFITATTRGKYANVKSIKPKIDELLLSVGVTQKIGATKKIYNNKKHISETHGTKTRFITDNPSVATVTSGGTVKAVGKGTATIYIQDIGGRYCKTKVTVE